MGNHDCQASRSLPPVRPHSVLNPPSDDKRLARTDSLSFQLLKTREIMSSSLPWRNSLLLASDILVADVPPVWLMAGLPVLITPRHLNMLKALQLPEVATLGGVVGEGLRQISTVDIFNAMTETRDNL